MQVRHAAHVKLGKNLPASFEQLESEAIALPIISDQVSMCFQCVECWIECRGSCTEYRRNLRGRQYFS